MKGSGRFQLKAPPDICLEDLRTFAKILSQGGLIEGCDSNPEPTKYKVCQIFALFPQHLIEFYTYVITCPSE
jgi:hypothetical protein